MPSPSLIDIYAKTSAENAAHILSSAATAIGGTAPSAIALVTNTEQILCRMRGSATPIGAATIRIYNELLPSKFTGDLKARREDDAS